MESTLTTIVRRQVVERFKRSFGQGEFRLFRAPGRVNLIGEHTDYNEGFVLPVAINREVWIAARRRSDREIYLASANFDAQTHFSLDDIRHSVDQPWSNYVRGVAWVLERSGYRLPGIDAAIAGNVPIGSGLSSSAALAVATAYAFRTLGNLDLTPIDLALLAQRAENEFVGTQCGIMDQFMASLGRHDHALLIDCRSLDYELVPLPAGARIVVADTMVKRQLVNSEYNTRRLQCAEAVRILQQFLPDIHALRDVHPEDLAEYGDHLPLEIYQRAQHIVTENARTLAAVAALRAGNLAEMGRLMDQSHASLRDDYEVSSPALDTLVELAQHTSGCYGSRMTGAGFGGCTVSLVRNEALQQFVQTIEIGYTQATGFKPEIYVCQITDGAGEVSDE